MMPYDDLFIWFGKSIALLTGGALIGAVLFRYWAQRWIDNRFSAGLQQARHEHERELQKLRASMDSAVNRAIRLHEKEFKVIPNSWKKLANAYAKVSFLAAPYQSHADISQMEQLERDEYLAKLDFSKFEVEQVNHSTNPLEKYIELSFWRNANDAQNAIHDVYHYIQINCIFMSPDLKRLFVQAADMLWDAAASKTQGRQMKNYDMEAKAWEAIRARISPLRDEIEAEVVALLRAAT